MRGDWWKTVFTIVTVALIALLGGPCILQCIMNFVTQRLVLFSQIGGRRARVQYIPEWCSYYELRVPRVGNEGGNRQNRLHLESRILSWAGLWTLSYMPISMETTYQLENQTPRMEEPQGPYLLRELPGQMSMAGYRPWDHIVGHDGANNTQILWRLFKSVEVLWHFSFT